MQPFFIVIIKPYPGQGRADLPKQRYKLNYGQNYKELFFKGLGDNSLTDLKIKKKNGKKIGFALVWKKFTQGAVYNEVLRCSKSFCAITEANVVFTNFWIL